MIRKGKGRPNMYVGKNTMSMITKGEFNDNDYLEGLLRSAAPDYKTLEEEYLSMFEPLRSHLYHYIKYTEPLTRKDLSRVRFKDLESATLGLRKVVEVLVHIGEAFNLTEKEKSENPAPRFEDKIRRLDHLHPNWIPKKVAYKNLNFKQTKYYIQRKLTGGKEYENRSIEQLTASENGDPLFNSDILHNVYKLSGDILHYKGLASANYILECAEKLKPIAKGTKGLVNRIDKASLFFVDKVSDKKEISGVISSIGDGKEYYYKWMISIKWDDKLV